MEKERKSSLEQDFGSGSGIAMKSDRNLIDPHNIEFLDPESSECGIDLGVQITLLVTKVTIKHLKYFLLIFSLFDE
jgi:hypothetical protein